MTHTGLVLNDLETISQTALAISPLQSLALESSAPRLLFGFHRGFQVAALGSGTAELCSDHDGPCMQRWRLRKSTIQTSGLPILYGRRDMLF